MDKRTLQNKDRSVGETVHSGPQSKKPDTIRQLPIGVFDSGYGGISVLREIVRLLPGEDIWFLGDAKNAPYGTKALERVKQLTMENVARMYESGIKAIVIACNTATSAAINALREVYTDIPVIGIEPALKPAANSAQHPNVLVLATPGTVAGEKFRQLLHGYEDAANIQAAGCPGLMDYVERCELDTPQLREYLSKLLAPYKGHTDVVVLGCTHYPFVKRAIARELGEDVRIVDGSEGTARELARRLKLAGLLRNRSEGGEVRFEMTLPGREEFCRMLLKMDL